MDQEKQYENDYKEFIDLLNKHKVEYMIVGAYAVMFHTHIARATEDIDFWINRTKENAERFAEVVKEFSGMNIDPNGMLLENRMVQIGVTPHRIDIFNKQGDILFQEAYARNKEGNFREVKATYLSEKDLLALKEYFHRDQDIKDIKRLKKNEEEQDNKPRGRRR